MRGYPEALTVTVNSNKRCQLFCCLKGGTENEMNGVYKRQKLSEEGRPFYKNDFGWYISWLDCMDSWKIVSRDGVAKAYGQTKYDPTRVKIWKIGNDKLSDIKVVEFH